jgi:spore coat polysaccharide biosynthesis protein SpsF
MRIGGLVHARMTSERLPGKPLAEIEGRAAILHLLDRMLACEYLEPDRVVLCTTTDPRDDVLAEFVESAGLHAFRGSTHDVIDRLYAAAAAHGFDAVVQVDGDDTCADPLYMDLEMRTLLADDDLDVVISRGLPLGLASKAIRFSALERVHDCYIPGDNSTGAFYYFLRTELCRATEVGPLTPEHVHSTARLTLDEPEDLAFFREVFAALYEPGCVFGVEQIVALLQQRPELIDLNVWLNETYYDRSDTHVERERLRYRTPEGVKEVDITPRTGTWPAPSASG